MRDEDCVAFLQWALPRLHMRWTGFRKVRAQVCKRLQRRLGQLGLGGLGDYRHHLAGHGEEWPILDGLLRITISRFYRDKGVFAFLADRVLPSLAEEAVAGCHLLLVDPHGLGVKVAQRLAEEGRDVVVVRPGPASSIFPGAVLPRATSRRAFDPRCSPAA